MLPPETARIVIDSRENFQKLQQFAQLYTPKVLDLLDHYTGERPLFDLHGVEDEIQKALARRVDLKSGGYLIIDQTEAMTTIDVNTGGFVGVRNFDDTIFKTNLEAAQTIARQLRLRNLGGIIILDFIDMENEEHRQAVLAEMARKFASFTGSNEFGTIRFSGDGSAVATAEEQRMITRWARIFVTRRGSASEIVNIHPFQKKRSPFALSATTSGSITQSQELVIGDMNWRAAGRAKVQVSVGRNSARSY